MPAATKEKIKISNSLSKLKEVVMPLSEVKKKGYDGNLLRRKSWPKGEFIWYKQPKTKYLTKEDGSKNEGFYAPITEKFLQKLNLKKFIIRGHWNKWNGTQIEVGYRFVGEDKDALDWEVIS